MKEQSVKKELWTCPKCGRQFERKGQSHSCKPYALDLHFVRKEAGKLLYEAFKKAVERQVGTFKIESLECCIHFVRTSTFAAVKIFKDKIQVEFSLSDFIQNDRFHQSVQISAHRYRYFVDLNTIDEIDEALMQWVQAAYNLS